MKRVSIVLVFVGFVSQFGSPMILSGERGTPVHLSTAVKLGYSVSEKITSYPLVSPRGSILFSIYKELPVIVEDKPLILSIDDVLKDAKDVDDVCNLLEEASRVVLTGKSKVKVPAVISVFEAPGAGPVYMHLSTTPIGFVKGGSVLKYNPKYGLGVVVNWQGWPLVEKYASRVVEKPTDQILLAECAGEAGGSEGDEEEWI